METTLYIKTVFTKYEAWKCHDPNHGHKSRERAQACIDQQERLGVRRTSLELHEMRKRRNKEILRLYLTVMTYKAIAERMGIKAGLVSSVMGDYYWRVLRWLERRGEAGVIDFTNEPPPHNFTLETLRTYYQRNKKRIDADLGTNYGFDSECRYVEWSLPPPPFFNPQINQTPD